MGAHLAAQAVCHRHRLQGRVGRLPGYGLVEALPRIKQVQVRARQAGSRQGLQLVPNGRLGPRVQGHRAALLLPLHVPPLHRHLVQHPPV